MNVTINGGLREVPDGMTVRTLVRFLELKEERIAVERNREIIPRSRWDAVLIQDGDVLEIVHFVGGGSGIKIGGVLVGMSHSSEDLNERLVLGDGLLTRGEVACGLSACPPPVDGQAL